MLAENIIPTGRDPYALLRQALRGKKRRIEILFEREHGHDDVPMTLLWQRGESLDAAFARLDAIQVDTEAGRAPRDAMLPCFEGLEHWVPRYLREELIGLINDNAITVEQIMLPDTEPADLWIRDYIDDRWSEGSPFRRAANAALAYLESLGVDLHTVHLHGRDVDERVTPLFVSFKLRYFRWLLDGPVEHGGIQWLEIVHPTCRSPLVALRICPIDMGKLARRRERPASFFFS